MPRRVRWLIRLAVLLSVVVAISASGPFWRTVWPGAVLRLRELQALQETAPFFAILVYVAGYAVITLLAIPVGPVASMAGGLLFGLIPGTLLAVAGATAGSALMFLLARGTIGRVVARKRQEMIRRIQPRLERDGFCAVLALRLAPVMPAWLVTIAAAIAGMRLRPFVVGTALGLVPVSLVLAGAGGALNEALATDMPPPPGLLFHPGILLPLLGLGLLAVLPIILKQSGRMFFVSFFQKTIESSFLKKRSKKLL